MLVMTRKSAQVVREMDKYGLLHNEIWKFTSGLRMSRYLCNNMQPDTQIAEHQWIRLTYNSTESYTTTLTRIGIPWKGIMDKGIIFRPFTNMELDFHVDFDFVGLCGFGNDHDLAC